jgi:hypothetical protein
MVMADLLAFYPAPAGKQACDDLEIGVVVFGVHGALVYPLYLLFKKSVQYRGSK